ncbi:DUF3631 domain-containing protein [Microbispora sp. H13382]|uniref:DUF3631 domain-containing protein n=1 Tax=Microbispora sp. H13382 TaxID=2729112 RepID=UPI0021760EC1|nr:DUF3631 domain-containing protein [Microbispora sp. H13382]
MPLEDRAADTWEPLVIAADHAGAHWSDRARAAALALTAEADDNGQTSTRIRLLADCRTAFGADTALPAAVLLERLKADPESGWADFGPTGLTPMKLGTIRREYDIRPATIRFASGQAKGYHRGNFANAWERYCPTAEPLPEAAVVPIGRGSRTSRTSINTSKNEAGTAGTAHPLQTAHPHPPSIAPASRTRSRWLPSACSTPSPRTGEVRGPCRGKVLGRITRRQRLTAGHSRTLSTDPNAEKPRSSADDPGFRVARPRGLESLTF